MHAPPSEALAVAACAGCADVAAESFCAVTAMFRLAELRAELVVGWSSSPAVRSALHSLLCTFQCTFWHSTEQYHT
jgi:hypothetical protein